MTPKHLLRKSVGPARYADKQIDVNDTTDVKAVIDNALGIIKHQVNTLSARAHNNGLLDNEIAIKNYQYLNIDNDAYKEKNSIEFLAPKSLKGK